MNKQRWTQAAALADAPYFTVVFASESSTGPRVYIARTPELPGCMAHGPTVEHALRELREARTEYIYSLLADGLPVPPPHEPLKNGEVYTVEVG
jgi:predicted RNase H-like HicB family nuclease